MELFKKEIHTVTETRNAVRRMVVMSGEKWISSSTVRSRVFFFSFLVEYTHDCSDPQQMSVCFCGGFVF